MTEGTIKNVKRRGTLVLGTVQHLTAEEERFAMMVFFARPACELDRFAADGLPAHATLERLREEANEPAYDDDYIPGEAGPEDWLIEPSANAELPAVVSGATPPYSASDTLRCKTNSEWR